MVCEGRWGGYLKIKTELLKDGSPLAETLGTPAKMSLFLSRRVESKAWALRTKAPIDATFIDCPEVEGSSFEGRYTKPKLDDT